MENNAKINIKIGELELNFEGSEDYLKNELPNLIETLLTYTPTVEEGEEESEILPESPDSNKRKLQITTNTIATKLSVKTGPDLVLSACAHLALVKGADSFNRKNILAEMKEATNYFKTVHRKNLSQHLKQLLKDGKIIERSKDVYALEAKTLKELEISLSA